MRGTRIRKNRDSLCDVEREVGTGYREISLGGQKKMSEACRLQVWPGHPGDIQSPQQVSSGASAPQVLEAAGPPVGLLGHQ